MNSINVKGNITKDAELRYTQSGKAVCSFSVADNFGKKGEPNSSVIFWKCVLWEKLAEDNAELLKKGKAVSVSGFIRKGKPWTDRQGNQREDMTINVQQIEYQAFGKQEATNDEDDF